MSKELVEQPSDEHEAEGAEQEWDLDAEWERARANTARDSLLIPESEISPYCLLYTGWFLGPAASFLAILILMGRRFQTRTLLFALGICGATWVLIQGATLVMQPGSALIEVRILRTGLNFVCGIVLLWFVLQRSGLQINAGRRTWVNTGVLLMLLIAVLWFASPDALYWLGR